MSLIQEMKQRKVFRVAAMYAVVAWAVLQFLDVVAEPLSLPPWFFTSVTILLGVGFPFAIIFSWIFDVVPAKEVENAEAAGSGLGLRTGIEIALLLVMIAGIGWLIFRDANSNGAPTYAVSGTPVVVLMDTYAAKGVYDEDTRRRGGTNADVLSDLLADKPVSSVKEAIGSTWDREAQIVKQQPALVMIHRSAFFHSMNQDLGVGYPGPGEEYSEEFRRLYEIADNKLVALLGYLGSGVPHAQFVIYSRGTGGGWPEEDYRKKWVKQAEGRYPDLKGRITAVVVPGGTAAGSFRTPEASEMILGHARRLLALEPAE